MNSSGSPAQGQANRRPSLLGRVLTLPIHIFGMLCGSLLLSILVECIGTHWFWPDEQWQHAQRLLDAELAHVSSYFTESIVVQEPGQTAHRYVLQAYETLFVDTGVLDWAQKTSARASAQAQNAKGFKRLIGVMYSQVEVYALAATYTTLTFVVRVLVLCLTVPLFLTAAFVGLIDGLVRRDIRRFGAGRESGFIYHRARASILPLTLLPWVAYLALPVSVHPLFILLPCALLLSIAVNVTAGSFKKYL